MNFIIYILLIASIGFVIYGILALTNRKSSFLLKIYSKHVMQEYYEKYIRLIGIVYTIMGFSILPLIIIEISNYNQYKYIGSAIWFVGFLSTWIIDCKCRKKYKRGIFM